MSCMSIRKEDSLVWVECMKRLVNDEKKWDKAVEVVYVEGPLDGVDGPLDAVEWLWML